MAGETQSSSSRPLPKFYFSITGLPPGTASFQEVTGLNTEAVLEYRHGDTPSFYPIKMPGLGKAGNVTMRKGIFINDTTLWDWLNQIKMNASERLTAVITLFDENATPKMVWTLNNASPIKVTGADLKSEGNEVAVESIEIAFETMIISAP